MLKLSGFSCLTSCLLSLSQFNKELKVNEICGDSMWTTLHEWKSTKEHTQRVSPPFHCDNHSHYLREASDNKNRTTTLSYTQCICSERSCELESDTKAGMLPEPAWKSYMRSKYVWITGCCNSQCLSHFAAPFIVFRTKTSIAERA